MQTKVHTGRAAPRHDVLPASAAVQVLPVRVYYEDTDAAGVVYYANYLRFCERARTEWLRERGFGQQALLAVDGTAFVVRSVQADYLSPARLDDSLNVITRIDVLRRASILFHQEIRRGDELLFVAKVLVACIDWHKQKPAPIPGAMHSQLESPTQA